MLEKMSQDVKLLLSLLLPLLLIHCVQHIYLTYGTLLQSYGLSHEATGWILGVFFMAAMVTRPLGGWLLESFGIRKALVFSGMLSFIGCSLFFFEQRADLLFIGRAISGAGFSIYTTGVFSHQAVCVSAKMRGAMFALLGLGGALPMSFMVPFGEWLLLSSRYTLYLAIGPALSLLCCFLGWRVSVTAAKEARGGGEKSWGTYRGLFSSRRYLVLLLTGTTIALIDAFIVNFSLLAAEKGLMASYFLASSSAAAVVLRLTGSHLLNVLPRVVLLAPCGILMSCAIIMASLFPTSGIFTITGILFGAAIGAGWPMYHSLIGDTLDPALLPKGTSTALLLFDFGFFINPLIVGYFLPRFGATGSFMTIALAGGGALALLEIFYWLPLYLKKRINRP